MLVKGLIRGAYVDFNSAYMYIAYLYDRAAQVSIGHLIT